MRVIEVISVKKPKLFEFALPEPGTDAYQDLEDILVLLKLKPSKEALAQVDAVLAVEQPAEPAQPAQTNLQQPAQPQAQPTQAQPVAQPTVQQPVQEPLTTDAEDEESLNENVIASLVERIQNLNPDDPKDAAKITKIEAILEDDVLDPAISSIVAKKFSSFVDLITGDIKNAIMSAANPIMEKIKFVTACSSGLLDLKKFFTDNPRGKIYEEINNPVFDNIKYRLGQIEYGTGGNKLGKMEALLTFIGKGVHKQGSGDLNLSDGTEIEVKASSEGKTGTSGAALVALGKDKDTGETAYGNNHEAGKIWVMRMKKVIPNVPISLNSSSIRKDINPYIANNPAKIKATHDALYEIYSFIFKNAGAKILAPLKKEKIMDENGINASALIKAVRQVEFDYYKSLIKHSAVLFINSNSGNYYYIQSGKELAKQLSASGAAGSQFYSTGILDMKGSYGNGFSKIFTV